MIVKKIEWLSTEAKEAMVLVADGQFECWTFAQPCDQRVGDHVELLHPLDPIGITISNSDKCLVERHADSLAYSFVGKLIDASNGIVGVGGLLFDLERMVPKDIVEGQRIMFSCQRVDVWN